MRSPIARLWREIRAHGPRSAADLVLRNLRAAPRAVYRRIKRDRFDSSLGVDTVAPVYASALGFDGERNHWYEVTPTATFDKLVAGAPIRHGDFTFIDLGSGKGRMLLLAAALPFRRVLGIELSPMLNEIANRNIARLPEKLRADGRVETLCADATEFEFPPTPLLIFFFNPFGAEVLSAVMSRLRESLAAHPREVLIVYLNSIHGRVLRELPWLEKIGEDAFMNETGERREIAETFRATQLD